MEEFCKDDDCIIEFDTSNCEPPTCSCGGLEMEHFRVVFPPRQTSCLELSESCDSIKHPLNKNPDQFGLIDVYREEGNVVLQISDNIDCGVVLISADNHVVFLQQQSQREVRPTIPTMGLALLEIVRRTGVNSITNAKSEDIVYEIFHSIVREIRDEINVPESSLSWPLLLGLVRNLDNGGKPHASFIMNCDLTKDAIEELYNKGGPEAYESTKIFFLKNDELMSYSLEELRSKLGNMTPCGKATLYLYFNSYKSTCTN